MAAVLEEATAEMVVPVPLIAIIMMEMEEEDMAAVAAVKLIMAAVAAVAAATAQEYLRQVMMDTAGSSQSSG